MEPSSLSQALQTLIDHASGDNPPADVQAAIAALHPVLEGIKRAQCSESFGPFTSVTSFIDTAVMWQPEDVADWITHGARKEAIDCWEQHVGEGWRLDHLCRIDLAPAIGQLITWHDRLVSTPG